MSRITEIESNETTGRVQLKQRPNELVRGAFAGGPKKLCDMRSLSLSIGSTMG